MAWYNKYRPKNFSEVIGQSLVKTVLENAIAKNRLKHAYLFSGPKGVGKTTLARIFANEINNTAQNPENSLDIIEMDAASHTGIDDIRQLIESAKTQPISGKYKIFIIDEVHMLSKNAMNALLKILEEPPEYLIFLLATTNAEKLIPTVLSRLTVLHLFNHTNADIVSRLDFIARNENVTIDVEALKIIANRSGGSQRDAINLLETIAGYNLDFYDANNTAELLGMLSFELLEKTARNLLSNESLDFNLVNIIESKGVDGQTYLVQLLEFLLDRSLAQNTEFDDLVLPVAEVLNLQLPITSVISALALVSVKLQEKAIPTVKKKLETDVKTALPLNHLPPIESEKLQQTGSPAKNVDPTDLNNKEELSINLASNSSHQVHSVDDIGQFITQIISSSQSPAVLKMLQKDLTALVRNQKLVLQNSNTIFQSAIKPAPIQNWIADQFEKHFGYRPAIILEIRNKNSTEKNPHGGVPTANEKMVENSTPDVPPSPDDSPKVEGNKIFYKVYNSLPENMENTGVKVRTGEIQLTSTSSSDWDDHARELFEFE